MIVTSAEGIVCLIFILIVLWFLHGYKRHIIRHLVEDGYFNHDGNEYGVNPLGRVDKPQNGLPDALLDEGNGAFAETTLDKLKFLKQSTKDELSTIKDDLALHSTKSKHDCNKCRKEALDPVHYNIHCPICSSRFCQKAMDHDNACDSPKKYYKK